MQLQHILDKMAERFGEPFKMPPKLAIHTEKTPFKHVPHSTLDFLVATPEFIVGLDQHRRGR